MLTSSPAGVALLNAQFGQGTGRIVLDDVRCSGSEDRLLTCTSAPILFVSSSCDHSDDAGVRCEGMQNTNDTIQAHCYIVRFSVLSQFLNNSFDSKSEMFGPRYLPWWK